MPMLAQNQDSLVIYSDLIFKQKNEQVAFQRLFKSESLKEMLQFYMAIDNAIVPTNIDDYEKNIIELVSSLKKKIANKKEAEQIAILKEKVESTFLKNYKANCSFNEILKDGNYDGLTKIEFYTLFLHQLNIPYQITASANIFNIKAYPDGAGIMIESNATSKIYFEFSKEIKSKFGNALLQQQTLTQEEFSKQTIDTLFAKNYFRNGVVTLAQLVSAQYACYSLIAYEKREVQEAIHLMQKAYYLDATNGNKFNLKNQIIGALGSNNYTDQFDLEKLVFLCKLHNIKDSDVNSDFIQSEYLRLMNAKYTKKTDEKDYNSFHEKITGTLQEQAIKNELTFYYLFEQAKFGLNDVESKTVEFNELIAAYQLKPESEELKTLILECLTNEIQETPDAIKALGIISRYNSYFTYTNSITSIIQVRAHCYLDLAYQNFIKSAMKEGEDYIKQSDEILKQGDVNPEPEFVERAYMSGARAYYNKGNKEKAKLLLKRGQSLAPNSTLIKDKLKMFQ
jgi:hypothetical protein